MDKHVCSMCSQTFSNKSKLAKHITEHSKTQENKSFQCSECKIISKTKSQIKIGANISYSVKKQGAT